MLLVTAFLTALAFSNAVIITNKELVYDYHAKIQVGSHEPVSYASQCILDGKLHIQSETPNTVLVRFSDLTHKLYNGELNGQKEHESKSLPLPQESSDLLRVFRIEYDEDGKLRNIVIESGEKQFAKNIKKAIASILQLDLKNIQLNSTIPHAFITEERSIYGKGLVEYNVRPQGNEILVHKMHDVKSSRHWFSAFNLNVEPQYTGMPINSPISIDSHRMYVLQRNEDGGVHMKQVVTHGGVYVYSLSGISGSHFVSVNQTMNLLDVIPIDVKYQVSNGDRTDHIEFKLDIVPETGVVDLTFGHHRIKKEQSLTVVQYQLNNAVNYLKDFHLTNNTSNVHRDQVINDLQQSISYLDVPALQELHNNLIQKTGVYNKQMLNIFYQMLPLVGSKASIIFIRNLIHTKKVTDSVAVDLLNKLPFYVQNPNEQLLQSVEDLLDLNQGVNTQVQNAAVLCFASLIHKVYAHQSWSQHNHEHYHVDNHEHLTYHYPGNWNSYHYHNHEHEHHHDDIVGNQQQENQLLERYIINLVSRLKTSNDYATQFLYMKALTNIQVGNVAKYLEPYVTGKAVNSNRHLQFLAICASLAGDITDPERVFQIYWPIFADHHLHLEVRAAAYVVIMSTQPTMTKLWNIYWQMQTEHCPELYHFYYTHIKSLAETKNPALQEFSINAAYILKFIKKPYRTHLSANYLFDYTDPKYSLGAMIQSMFISTNTSKTLYFDWTNHVMNVPFQYYSIYLKIDGLDSSYLDKIPKERYDIHELEEIVNWISTISNQPQVHIEYAIYHHNQVVRVGVYDQRNVKDFVSEIWKYVQIEDNSLLKTSLHIQYNLLSQLILPNDLGLPVFVQAKWPTVTNNEFNITREVLNKITNIHAEVRLQTSIHSTYETKFYNTIADIWQGVQHLHSYDHVIPLSFNAAVNTQQHSIKLTVNHIHNERQGSIGLRNHVTSEVFVIEGEQNYLQQSNSQCEVNEVISKGKQQRKDYNLLEVDDKNTGLQYQVIAFDSEHQVSGNTLHNLLNSISQNSYKNCGHLPLVCGWFTLRNLWTRLILYPSLETTGILIRAVPSTNNIITHIDLSARYNREINKEENKDLPSTKLNTRTTYSVKAGEKLIKTWDVNAVVDLNSGHTVNNYKVQVTKIVPDQKDYKICIEGIKKWVQTGVTGHLSLAIGHSVDGKCNKDDALIEVNMKGDHVTDGNCSPERLYHSDPIDLNITQTVHCIEEQTAIRHYEYDIKSTKLSEHLTSKIHNIIHLLQSLYIPYYSHQLQRNPIEENNVKVIINYTTTGEVNIQVVKPQESYSISGLSIPDLVLIQPDNYHMSKKFLVFNELGLIKTCIVTNKTVVNEDSEVVSKVVANDWVEYIKDSIEQPTIIVSLKQTGNQPHLLALRLVSQEQILEVIPDNGSHQIILNGQPLQVTENTYHQGSWFSVGVLKDKEHTVVLHVHKVLLYITYNQKVVRFDVSRFGSELVGECFHK